MATMNCLPAPTNVYLDIANITVIIVLDTYHIVVVLYYSDSVRSNVCTDVVLFGAVCSVYCCCFVLCVVVASRVSCVRRGGGPISCCGTEAQSVIRSPNLPGVARDGYRVLLVW